MAKFLKKLLGLYVLLLIILAAAAFIFQPENQETTIAQRLFTYISAATLTGSNLAGDLSQSAFPQQAFVLLIIQLSAFWQLVFALSFAAFAGQNYLISNSKNVLPKASLVKKTILYLLLLEAFSAVCIYAFSSNISGNVNTVFSAIFYGISIFTASGFSLCENGFASTSLADAYIFQLVLAGIIIISYLGYIVYFDLANLQRLRARMLDPKLNWLRHTRIGIYILAAIILTGSILFWLFEGSYLLAGSKAVEAGISALINICGAGGSGVSTFSIDNLQNETLVLLGILMLLGPPGGSVAGGLTLTAWILIFVYIINRKNAYNNLIKPAFAVIIFTITCIAAGSFLLKIIQPGSSYGAHLFNAISAFTNNGFHMGKLNSGFEMVTLSALMLGGRLGIAAVVLFAYIYFEKKASVKASAEIALL